MMWTICYLITFLACIIGTICGMGGGIIIKPVLDATGLMSVSTITFLSGCTVIAMAAWSIGKNLLKGESALDVRTTGVLAVSAAAGGLLGKQLYALTAGLFANRNTAGGVQAALLLAATFATLIYTLRKDRLSSRHISSPWANLIIGLLLGLLGAFLGIGGGPIQCCCAVLFFLHADQARHPEQSPDCALQSARQHTEDSAVRRCSDDSFHRPAGHDDCRCCRKRNWPLDQPKDRQPPGNHLSGRRHAADHGD